MTYFDDSLPVALRTIEAALGARAMSSIVALRDVSGQLAFVSGVELGSDVSIPLERELRAVLGGYARDGALVRGPEGPGAAAILAEASQSGFAPPEDDRIKMIDRRIVGSDWLRPPLAKSSGIPRIAFTSIREASEDQQLWLWRQLTYPIADFELLRLTSTSKRLASV